MCIDVSCVCVQRRGVGEGEGRKCRAQRVWVGTLFSTERSPLFSTACPPQHRSYQATLNGLNGLAGMAAEHPPSSPLHPTALNQTVFVLHSFHLFLILYILLLQHPYFPSSISFLPDPPPTYFLGFPVICHLILSTNMCSSMRLFNHIFLSLRFSGPTH